MLLFRHPVVSDSLRCHGLTAARRPLIPHHLPKFAQIHIHCIGDPIQPSHHLMPASPSALSLSQHPVSQLFASDERSIGVSASASVLLMSIQGWFPLRLTGLVSCCPRDSQESSPAPQSKRTNSSALCLLYGPALTTLPDHWEDHNLDYTGLCWQSVVPALQHTV